MNNLKIRKGDLMMMVNPVTKQTEWINPSNIYIFIGKVELNEKGQKQVTEGTPKKLGVFLSEKEDEIQTLKDQLKETKETLTNFKASYKKTMKEVVKLLELVVPQLELNSVELNNILDNMEE